MHKAQCPTCGKINLCEGLSPEESNSISTHMTQLLQERSKEEFRHFVSTAICTCHIPLEVIELACATNFATKVNNKPLRERIRQWRLPLALVGGLMALLAFLAIPGFALAVVVEEKPTFARLVIANYCLAILWTLACFLLWALFRIWWASSSKVVPGWEWRYVLPDGRLGGKHSDVTWAEYERRHRPKYGLVFLEIALIHFSLASASSFVNGRLYLRIWDSWVWW